MNYAEPLEVDALSFLPLSPSLSSGATLLIKTPIFSHLFAAYYLIARLTSSVLSASPTILSLDVPQLELINSIYVCMVITSSRVWIDRVMLSILLVVS